MDRPRVVVGVNEWELLGLAFFWAFTSPFLLAQWPVPLIVVAILSPITALGVFSYFRKTRRVEALLKALDGGRPLAVSAGYLETFYLSAGRRSKSWVRFEPLEPSVAGAVRPGRYVYVSGPNWEYLKAYAYRIEDDCCRGLYVAAIVPEEAYSLSSELSASSEFGDMAKTSLRPAGPGLVEASVEAWLIKARKARLELEVSLPHEKKTIRLLEVQRGQEAKRFDFAGGPFDLIVAGPTGLKLKDVFRKDLAGLAPSLQYRAKLVLDMPMARDVVVSAPATPVR
ncbi:MAG: hypothetical protein ABWJ97_01005 [Thermoproteus sp.]